MAKKLQRTVAAKRPAAPPAGAAPRPAAPRAGRRRGRRVSSQAINEFTVQLATLTEAGIPIVRALSILEGQTRPGPFRTVLGELVEDVSAGTPLSEALRKHERAFDELYAAMVRAGEAGGVLDTVLNRLAAFRERIAEIRAKIVGAMIYPLVIVVVAVIVVTAVILFVIPKFEAIFRSFDIELPGVTRLLLNVSHFAVTYWYAVFGAPALLLVLHGYLMRRRGAYRYRMHALLLRLPLLGGVLKRALIAGFSRTFGTLLQAGVPHLDALGIVRDASGNEVLIEGVEAIRRTVREGEGIARPMGDTGVFDELVTNMVEVGEQTGELDQMLLRVADAYEKQVDRRIDALFKVLEPLLLIVMAVFVGFIVVALFLPLMKIMSTLNQP
ncbi:MAG: type II secretion system F family protein [Planctomycetota bacterium]